ncbi:MULTISPECIES: porphobilinogen synthase [Asticcacaulis]|uniref:porphobilinogen synthase n=1 Tax=Asticcacaulis TaxID=76890 RepID=UPI001AE845CE|nr:MULTISPECIES: porphobilinogen synthase [Asticcacaulis]MBP2158390.1 porphobilinogen synthase [Asticcacaulis solisilvae]MDR6799435.1 porphobilinogen synthase [Asticcacaulis sp. BE141]
MSYPTPAPFPLARPRRLRQSAWIRDLVSENRLHVSDLIWPIFIHDRDVKREAIGSLQGVDRLSIDEAVNEARQAKALGINVLALFPHLSETLRNSDATAAIDSNGLIPRTCRAIKAAVPDIGLLVDVALDPYTDHGHDGLLRDGKIVNDATVEMLVEQARVQVEAGADIVAPSDMMDGRIGRIRHALEANGYSDTLIMSYAAKYASAFYGPYRDAIGVKALKGDKKTYQMDSANSEEALREVAMDIAEGADMVMVKPGLPYLDIVQRVSETFRVPTFVYQVSGEYAMIKAAVEKGFMDEDRAVMETLLAFKRAGASGILTYFAKAVAEKLKG